MYYKRGPLGLIIISIIVLGTFLELAENIEIGVWPFILISCVVCPFISKVLYAIIKNNQRFR